jgi:hypothetical protein
MNKNDSLIASDVTQSGTSAFNTSLPLDVVLSAAWACAHSLLANVMYIQKELPSIDVPDIQRSAIEQICSTLAGTKHDVVSELFELQDFVGTAAPEAMQQRVVRIVKLFAEDLTQLHEVVQELSLASSRDERVGLAYLLVSESATNMLRSFGEVIDAAERYSKAIASGAP